MNIAFIGAGNMGAALCRRIIDATDATVTLCDRNEEKLAAFSDTKTTLDPVVSVEHSDCIFIAVKPQSFDDFCNQVGSAMNDKLIISIMAGVTIDALAKKTDSHRVVRSLPNLGVQVGRGVTLWAATSQISAEDRTFVENLFNPCGIALEIEESKMDEYSTISGCGPAYFYSLCSILKQEAVKLGMAERDAEQMAKETCIGSILYMQNDQRSPEELVSAVASKGGITQAALDSLQADGRSEMFARALQKATERSRDFAK